MISSSSSASVRRVSACLLLAGAANACGKAGNDAAADSPAASPGSTARQETPAAVATTTPDQRFLRWMLAHHAELVYVAHEVLKRPDKAVVLADARRLDETHDAEAETMKRVLTEDFSDNYVPEMRQEHAAMVAPFATMTTQNLRDGFRSFLAAHHNEAIKVTDSLLPTLTNPRVRALADSLRAARARDIQVLLPGRAAR